MLTKLLLGTLFVLGGGIGYIATRPSEFKIVRSQEIKAPASEVFALLNDFHQWEKWSPWAKMDPAMKASYSGSPTGVGAIYDWSGNDEVGTGRMTIMESNPDSKVGIRLEFMKPFEQTNRNDFVVKPTGSGVNVEWTMSGENNFMGKAYSTFVNMDQTVGADFEKGLRQLKAEAEK
jgi:uncharacterized protein YndB with AHSA1/START domain